VRGSSGWLAKAGAAGPKTPQGYLGLERKADANHSVAGSGNADRPLVHSEVNHLPWYESPLAIEAGRNVRASSMPPNADIDRSLLSGGGISARSRSPKSFWLRGKLRRIARATSRRWATSLLRLAHFAC
jgi:hypothetical protein